MPRNRIPYRKSKPFLLYDRHNSAGKKKRCNKLLGGVDNPDMEYSVNTESCCLYHFGESRQLPIEKTDKDIEMMWAYKRLRGENQ